MISQFAVGILAHSSDAKILSKYFGEPRIADILQKQNIGKISQTLNLSQMLFSRLIGRIFKKQDHNNSSKFIFIHPVLIESHAELLVQCLSPLNRKNSKYCWADCWQKYGHC